MCDGVGSFYIFHFIIIRLRGTQWKCSEIITIILCLLTLSPITLTLKDFYFFHLNFQILKLQILKLVNHVQRMTDAKLDDAAALQHLEHLGVEDGNAMLSNFEQQKRHEKTKTNTKVKTSKTNKDNTKPQKSMNTRRRSNIGTDTEAILRHVIKKAE